MSAIPGMYPSDIGVPVRDETIDSLHREGAPATIRAPKDGYLQTLDPHRLFEAIGGLPVVVRVERRLGDFVMTGEALARVWPAELVNVERASGITGAFAIAAERTAEQDIEYALIGLSDIAVKALSPSINDPTTAVLCIDRLGEILLAIGRRELPHRIRTDQMGHARVLVPGSDLARAAGVAIRQIAHHGASNPGVVKRLLDILARVGALLPPERRDSLRVEFDYVVDCARSQLELPADLQDVERVLHELESAVSEGAGGAQRPAVDRLTSSRPPAPEPSRHR